MSCNAIVLGGLIVSIDIVVLRLLHIIFGALWVGTILFMVLFLRPRLRSLGAEANRKLTNAIERAVDKSTGISGTITVIAGITLALRLRWGHLDTFFNTGWGYAILIGFIAAIAAFVAGGMSTGIPAKATLIIDEMQVDSSNDEQSILLKDLDSRLIVLERLHALFVLIAVGSMASARFVQEGIPAQRDEWPLPSKPDSCIKPSRPWAGSPFQTFRRDADSPAGISSAGGPYRRPLDVQRIGYS